MASHSQGETQVNASLGAGEGRFITRGARAGQSPGPVRLELHQYPRWAELVQRGLYLMPPAMHRENPTLILGVLRLLHEHVPAPWSLTITEGHPDIAPDRCKESRNHLHRTEDGWAWVIKHERRAASRSNTLLSALTEPATVAEHARLVRGSQAAPLQVYGWGGEGYIAVLNMAGVTLAIRDMPGMPEANEILLSRESMEGHALDRLDIHSVVTLFGREDSADYDTMEERAEGLIDDETTGFSAIPSAFMALSKPRDGQQEGILQTVNRQMRQAGPGREAYAWEALRASDQYRFNLERLRHLVIPGVLENTPSHAPGAASADILMLMGIVRRMEQGSKPLDGLGQKTLPEVAISMAVEHLGTLRERARHDEVRSTIDARLILLAQTWMHHRGEVPAWSPLPYRGELACTLDAFMSRLTEKAQHVLEPW